VFLRKLASSLDGEATFAVTDGQLKGRRMNLLAEGLVTKVLSSELLRRLFLEPHRKSTPVPCAVAHLEAKKGRVVTRASRWSTEPSENNELTANPSGSGQGWDRLHPLRP
jgi:hypothetical protein